MKLIIIISITILLTGCNKLVQVDLPSDRITRDAVFQNDVTAIAALNGMYTQMIRTSLQLSSGGATLYPALSADELYNSASSTNYDEFSQNGLSASNPLLRLNFWTPAYNIIYQANSIIEGAASSNDLSPAVKQQLEGEAKFTRAFFYLYLVNLFGDVPLVTSTAYAENAILPRTPSADVYAQIIKDLEDAKTILSDPYQGPGRTRVNKWAASALLARVYLYRGLWDKAEAEAGAVIGSGTYSLVTPLNNVFLIASNETIFQLMPTSTSTNSPDGSIFIPASGIPSYPLTATLANAFSAADQRKVNWTKSTVVSGTTYYYPFKYKVKTATSLTEYYVALRLAEQYLIRAEARAQQNKLSLALSDLNLIRARAGLPAATATDIAGTLLLVEKERQLELFAEWGHRWLDLKRTGRALSVLANKPGWNATDTLYPIPQAELLRNTALTQNPGY